MPSIYLRLANIYEYAKGTPNSRNMKEGEEVLKSGQIVFVGCDKKMVNEVHILSLVLQTSALSSYPHTIKGCLVIENCNVIIKQMECSSKAGLSGSCKHVVAVLLYMERNDIMELEDSSCTDVKCAWTSRKPKVQSDFAADPTGTFWCVPEIEKLSNIPDEEFEDLFVELCRLNPDSAISKHARGRDTLISNQNERVVIEHFTDDVVEKILNNETLHKVTPISTAELKSCCKSTFESLAVTNSGELCRETLKCHGKKQGNCGFLDLVYMECIHIPRIQNLIGNKNPRNFFSLPNSQIHLETYENDRNVKVVQCGFVVHPEHLWIGYSPDGLVFGESGPEKLIEIKCVYAGRSKSVTEYLTSCTFLDEEGGLKKKHSYYGQIQLGMLLCNVKKCDFDTFASFDKSIDVLSVPFDENFALAMFTVVQKAYANEMIHHVCLNRNQEQGQS